MRFFDTFKRSAPKPEPQQAVTYEQTFQTALKALDQGHTAIAQELLERVAVGVPQDPDSCHALGATYIGTDFAKAAKWFKEVVRRSDDPEQRALAFQSLIFCYMQLGDEDQAAQYLRDLNVIRPDLARQIAGTLSNSEYMSSRERNV